MAIKNNFAELINNRLMVSGVSLNMPEHKLKKFFIIFNDSLRYIFEEHKDRGIYMYQIILSLSEYFDMTWLKENLLDKNNLIQIEAEMIEEYNIKSKKTSKKTSKKKISSIPVKQD